MNYVLIGKIIDSMPKPLARFVSKAVVKRYINKFANLQINGSENIENLTEPVLFICNHLSNSDGLILSMILKQVDPTFVSGVKLSDDIVTKIGMNAVKTTNIKPNSADLSGVKKIVSLVKQGESILIFPEGTRSRTGSLIAAKKGVYLISKLTKVNIVPIGLVGTEKLLPINNEGNMSKESFRYADVTINIGMPFSLPTNENKQNKAEFEAYCITQMMKKIAGLLPEEYRGVYK